LHAACRPDGRPTVSFAWTRTPPSRWPVDVFQIPPSYAPPQSTIAAVDDSSAGPTTLPALLVGCLVASSPPRLARTALADAAMPASTTPSCRCVYLTPSSHLTPQTPAKPDNDPNLLHYLLK
jgi:hypothetical protein